MVFFYRKNTSDIKAIKEAYENRGYERKDFKVEKGELWLDIGANIGAFTKFALEKGAKVKAFEPDPEHFDLLILNCQKYEFEPFCCGLSDFNAEKTLYCNTKNGNTWRNSIMKSWRGGTEKKVIINDISLIMKDLESVNIKLDAEGVELPILNKLMVTGDIKKVEKLVFEWSFDIIPEISKFFEILKKLEKTHKILNVSENYIARLSKHKIYPSSWFPPTYKVFATKLYA